MSESTGHGLYAADIETLQVNVGLVCNQQCAHCHVAASPKRKESMSWDTMQSILRVGKKIQCRLVDITGGAPELNPNFVKFIVALRNEGFTVQVRTNLTVLLESSCAEIPEFYREHGIHLVASLPCYLEENVDKQRGEGVYTKSIEALRMLNRLGYGHCPEMPLNLVYNPIGAVLPPSQEQLQEDYRRELKERFGISFTQLLTITNMPIGRFRSDLRRDHHVESYMQLLQESFNPSTVDNLMCRHQLSIDWDGNLYDCDFNLAMKLPVDHGAPNHLDDFDAEKLLARRILTGEHCFACTAGCGSSCSGALVDKSSAS